MDQKCGNAISPSVNAGDIFRQQTWFRYSRWKLPAAMFFQHRFVESILLWEKAAPKPLQRRRKASHQDPAIRLSARLRKASASQSSCALRRRGCWEYAYRRDARDDKSSSSICWVEPQSPPRLPLSLWKRNHQSGSGYAARRPSFPADATFTL